MKASDVILEDIGRWITYEKDSIKETGRLKSYNEQF